MIAKYAAIVAVLSAPAFAGPVYRLVTELDQDAVAQAQQTDDTATKAFSNTNIRTSSGKCLFVDELSGDSTANLTPIQVAACGSTAGQGFDVITQGKHNDVEGSILVVSTLTQACFTFDPTQTESQQVMLYSCGGVADGTGNVTTSQLFAGDGSTGPVTLAPENKAGSCLTVKGNSVGIADCDSSDSQTFTFDGVASQSDGESNAPAESSVAASSIVASSTTEAQQLSTATCDPVTVTETETVTITTSSNTEQSTATTSTDTTTTTTLFVTVAPASTGDEADITSSTTTILITVLPIASTSAAAATSAQASSEVPSDTNTIPQISINPTTTVVAGSSAAVTRTAARSSVADTTSAAPTTTAAPTSKAASDPNTIPQISINPSTTVLVS